MSVSSISGSAATSFVRQQQALAQATTPQQTGTQQTGTQQTGTQQTQPSRITTAKAATRPARPSRFTPPHPPHPLPAPRRACVRLPDAAAARRPSAPEALQTDGTANGITNGITNWERTRN